MILSKPTIKDLLASGALVIEPSPPPEAYGPDSVDLRLGREVAYPQAPDRFVNPDAKDMTDFFLVEIDTDSNGDSDIWLLPRARVLVSTFETIVLPNDVAGMIVTRSRWARIFVEAIGASCFIHAGWSGRVVLEVRNDGPFAVKIPRGASICSLVLMRLDQPSDGYTAQVFTRYKDQKGV